MLCMQINFKKYRKSCSIHKNAYVYGATWQKLYNSLAKNDSSQMDDKFNLYQ